MQPPDDAKDPSSAEGAVGAISRGVYFITRGRVWVGRGDGEIPYRLAGAQDDVDQAAAIVGYFSTEGASLDAFNEALQYFGWDASIDSDDAVTGLDARAIWHLLQLLEETPTEAEKPTDPHKQLAETVGGLDRAARFITKGLVRIQREEGGYRLTGSEVDLEHYRAIVSAAIPGALHSRMRFNEALAHFGWDVRILDETDKPGRSPVVGTDVPQFLYFLSLLTGKAEPFRDSDR